MLIAETIPLQKQKCYTDKKENKQREILLKKSRGTLCISCLTLNGLTGSAIKTHSLSPCLMSKSIGKQIFRIVFLTSTSFANHRLFG